jgi:hypothetical protein
MNVYELSIKRKRLDDLLNILVYTGDDARVFPVFGRSIISIVLFETARRCGFLDSYYISNKITQK